MLREPMGWNERWCYMADQAVRPQTEQGLGWLVKRAVVSPSRCLIHRRNQHRKPTLNSNKFNEMYFKYVFTT